MTIVSFTQAAQRRGDTVFSRSALAAGISIVVLLAAVSTFLIVRSLSALTATAADASLLTSSFWAYVTPLVFGTIWAAALALVISLPLAIGCALFITHYAPRRLANALGYLIDLLAAVPSVVFGLWGIGVLAPAARPVYSAINNTLGQVPVLSVVFGGTVSATGRTIFTAALVLAVMILPVMAALCREVFLQTPRIYEEAALALGATRWEMIKATVLPYGRAGIVSAAMLGLGRALGETMAVAMVLSATGAVSLKLFTSDNPSTIAANIALNFPEAYGMNINLLIATGLILFLVTLAVNIFARKVVVRDRSAQGGA